MKRRVQWRCLVARGIGSLGRPVAWLGVTGLTVLAAMMAWSTPLYAESRTGIDAVLVLDSSGSMKQTDPDRLRVPAAKLFLSLLRAEDRVAVISFSDRAYPIVELSALGSEPTRARLLQAVDKVSSDGAHTNLHDALVAARSVLNAASKPASARYIILMSDGKMDVGDRARDASLLHAMRSDVLAAIKGDGIRVYSLAFTRASDIDLLRTLAEDSEGLFQLAETDKELHGVFARLFEGAKQPDMLAIEGGEFVADGNIQEVNIIASKERAAVRIYVRDPDGKRYTRDEHRDDMRWFAAERFEMITIPYPKSGTWKLLFSEGENKAYIVTDLQLETNVSDRAVSAGQELAVQAWLRREGKTVDQLEFLDNSEFLVEILQPDGQVARHSLFDLGKDGDDKAGDGVHGATIPFYKEGPHQVTVTVRAKTFGRQIKRYVNVQPAAATGEPTPVATPPPAEPEPVPPPAEPEPAEPATEEPTPAAPQSLSLGWLLVAFLAFNAMIAGVWILVVALRRKKAAVAQQEAAEASK